MKKSGLIVSGVLLALLLSGCSAKNSATKVSSRSSTSTLSSSTSSSSSVASSTSESSKSTESSSSTSTATTTSVDFGQLSVASQNKLYAAWLQNAQGQFVVYNATATTTYLVNEGQNGTKMYENGKKVGNAWAGYSLAREQNAAKVVISDNSVSLFVPSKTNNNIDGNWSDLVWTLQEKLTKDELMQKYYQTSQGNQQIVLTKDSAPD